MEQQPNKEVIKESSLEYYYDLEREVNLFSYNIFNNRRKSHRDLIYRFFPELTDMHVDSESLTEQEIHSKIKKAILDFREKYADNIKQAEANIVADLPEIDMGIKTLEDLMGETEHFKYLVMPSVYPTCPFDVKRNLFYFSITQVNSGQTKFDRLSSTAPHEISHFIFFRQIKSIPNKLSDIGIHHLKEVLTPVLLQHPDILKHRQSNFVWGNTESIDYKVEVNGEVVRIFDYVNSEYLKNPTSEGYMPFLLWLIRLFEQTEPEIIKRDELFSENGRKTFSDPELKAKFMEPIKI
ncbi:MAG: hypothetical protein WCC74_03475 [Minisyncoccia bacterium]